MKEPPFPVLFFASPEKCEQMESFRRRLEKYRHHVCSAIKQEVKGSRTTKFSTRRGISALAKITST